MLTLTISNFCVTNFKANTSYEYAKHLRSITEHMDKEMAAEVAIKKRFHQSEDGSDDLPDVADVADGPGPGAYQRSKTATEGMYQPIQSEISPEPNTRVHHYMKNVPLKTAAPRVHASTAYKTQPKLSIADKRFA